MRKQAAGWLDGLGSAITYPGRKIGLKIGDYMYRPINNMLQSKGQLSPLVHNAVRLTIPNSVITQDSGLWIDRGDLGNTALNARQLGYSAWSTLSNVGNTLINGAESVHALGASTVGALAGWLGLLDASLYMNKYVLLVARQSAARNKKHALHQRDLARAAGWVGIDNLSNRYKLSGTNIGAGDISGVAVGTALPAGPVVKALKGAVSVPAHAGKMVFTPVANAMRGIPYAGRAASVLPAVGKFTGGALGIAGLTATTSLGVPGAVGFIDDHIARLPQVVRQGANDWRRTVRSAADRIPGLRIAAPWYGVQRAVQTVLSDDGYSYIDRPFAHLAATSLGNPYAFGNGKWWNPKPLFVAGLLDGIPKPLATGVAIQRADVPLRLYIKAVRTAAGLPNEHINVTWQPGSSKDYYVNQLLNLSPLLRSRALFRIMPHVGKHLQLPDGTVKQLLTIRDRLMYK